MFSKGYGFNKTAVLFVAVLMLVFIAMQFNHPIWFRKFRPDAKVKRSCTPKDVQDDMLSLAYDVHLILRDLNITHFLMYGSLWGALRINKPLPWDDDVDLGMIPDGKYSLLSEEKFLEKFRQKGVKITNNMRQKSSFKFERGKGAVDLMIYYVYGEWMKREGWEPWLLTVHYNLHHTFPRNLIAHKPLPQLKFGWFMMPVPQSGIEIMKHMYRYDWWVTYKTESCWDRLQS